MMNLGEKWAGLMLLNIGSIIFYTSVPNSQKRVCERQGKVNVSNVIQQDLENVNSGFIQAISNNFFVNKQLQYFMNILRN